MTDDLNGGTMLCLVMERIPMKTTIQAAGCALLCAYALNVAAQNPHHKTVVLDPFDVGPYVLRVTEIAAQYSTGPGSVEERLRLRNKEVRSLFENTLRNRERPRWARHQVFMQRDLSCKNNHPGSSKMCPGSFDWSSGYAVIPQSVEHTRKHFKTEPTIGPEHKLSWVLGVTGEDTNTGKVLATAQYAPWRIDAGIEADKVVLRKKLETLNLPTDHAIDP
jgi:hypothetical protein